nr:hypothetical protein [Saprospiraceae bacterium]
MIKGLVIILVYFAVLISINEVSTQNTDLLSMIEEEEEEQIEYAFAAFKTNRVINMHSLESTSEGVLDVKISHRFGMVNSGPRELFGLDAATVRLGADYGLTDRITIGFGRSSFQKTYDGYVKYKFLRQSSGAKKMPITAAFWANTAINTTPWRNPERRNYFTSRLYYTFQLIMGRKFSDGFSLQLSPTLVHRNLVETTAEANDVYALGGASRIKLSNRVALNFEYIYVFPDQLADGFRNSLSIGFDIETGGHVFQLHFTNSTSMVEHGFITTTTGNWLKGGVHFGFNVSRVFTIKKPDFD